MSAQTIPPTLPAGTKNIFLFTTFNALSYQIILSSPMVLYAKTLGASATVLGVLAGMMPMLVIFQIPAAKHVDRIGYKRFIYAGWHAGSVHYRNGARSPHRPLSGFHHTTGASSYVFILFQFVPRNFQLRVAAVDDCAHPN